MVWRGSAWFGVVHTHTHGSGRQGWEWCGKVRLGKAWHGEVHTHGQAGSGVVRQGMAWCGKASPL